jgi:hypothetical protein
MREVGRQRELRVDGSSSLEALLACFGSCRNGDSVLGQVRGCQCPDSLVEAVIIAEEDVATAQAVVMLDNYYF